VEDAAERLPLEDALDAGERDRLRLLRDEGAATAIAAGSTFFRQSRLASQARCRPVSRAMTACWATPTSACGRASIRWRPYITVGQPARDLCPLRLSLLPAARAAAPARARAGGARRLEPLERGDLFHRVAERFLRERRVRGELPLRDSEPLRERLRVMAEEALEDLIQGSPPRSRCSGAEKRRFHETLQAGCAARRRRGALDARALRGQLRLGRR